MKYKIHSLAEHEQSLNQALIKKQKLSPTEVTEIARLHQKRETLFLAMSETPLSPKLKEAVKELEDLEFALQKAWGFTQDPNYHTWWYRAPHCSCPKLDNQDNYGTSMRVINQNCVLHGK